MSAAEALRAADAAGICIGIDGDDLTLEASVAQPPAVLDQLSSHKAGVMAPLRRGNDGCSAEGWQVLCERALTRSGFAANRLSSYDQGRMGRKKRVSTENDPFFFTFRHRSRFFGYPCEMNFVFM